MAETRSRRPPGGARVPLPACSAWTAQPELGGSKRNGDRSAPAQVGGVQRRARALARLQVAR